MGLKALRSLQVYNLLNLGQIFAFNNHYASYEKFVSEAEPSHVDTSNG